MVVQQQEEEENGEPQYTSLMKRRASRNDWRGAFSKRGDEATIGHLIDFNESSTAVCNHSVQASFLGPILKTGKAKFLK